MPEVQGPDGQRYQFPEGTSPDVMRAAMAKRYPKPEAAPSLAEGLGVNMPSTDQFQNMYEASLDRKQGFERSLSERGAKRRAYLESDPENIGWSSPKTDAQLGATQYGKSDGLFLGLGDEVTGLFNPEEGKRRSALKSYAREAYPQDFFSGEMHGGAVNALATMSATGPKMLQAASLAPKALRPTVAGAQGATVWDATHQLATADGGLGERLGDFDVGRSAAAAAIGGGFGTVLGGAAALLSKGEADNLVRGAAAEIEALDTGSIRPQALDAFNRLLRKSGMTDDEIIRLHNTVRDRQSGVSGGSSSAEGRKRTFQHYMEVLAEDEAGELYNPQAASNILMTVQERANSARPGDASRGIVGAAVKSDRASQVPFLEESAQGVSQGSRVGTNELVKTTRADLGGQYEAALDPSKISPQGQQEAAAMIESIGPLLNGPSGLKVQAAAEGVDIDTLIGQNPMKALHWIQSAARRKAQSADPNRAAYAAIRQRALPVIENNVDAYRALRRNYASNEGLDKAKTFGDRLFGGSQSNVMNNPGMRGELVAEFEKLTDIEKQVALTSIRDQALGKIAGGSEDAPARLSQLDNRNALDFLEQVGQKQFADDIRAIGRENRLLSVADAGNPLRQSATFSNAQSRAEAPGLYNSTVANAVDNSTPGTMLGEGMLMAFAPHYQGAYAAYRGGRMAAAAGLGTRKKTLEDMTRFLMSRAEQQKAIPPAAKALTGSSGNQPSNAFAPQGPTTASGQGPANAFGPRAPVAEPPVQNGFFGFGKKKPEVNPDEFFTDSHKGSAVMSPRYPSAEADDAARGLGLGNEFAGDASTAGLRQRTNESLQQFEQMVTNNPNKQSFVFSLPESPEVQRETVEQMLKVRDRRRFGPSKKSDTVLVMSADGGDMALVDRELTQRGGAFATTEATQGSGVNWFRINDVSDFDAVPYSSKNVVTRGKPSTSNGLPMLSGPTATGAVVGGTSGSVVDYNQDGKTDATDMAIGALIGGLGGKGAGKLDSKIRTTSGGLPTLQNGIGGRRRKDVLRDAAQGQFPATQAPRTPPGGLPQRQADPGGGYAPVGDGGEGLGLLLGLGAAGGGAMALNEYANRPPQANQPANAFAAPQSLPMMAANSAQSGLQRRQQGLPFPPNVKPDMSGNVEQLNQAAFQQSKQEMQALWSQLGTNERLAWNQMREERAAELEIRPEEAQAGVVDKRLLPNGELQILMQGEWRTVAPAQ